MGLAPATYAGSTQLLTWSRLHALLLRLETAPVPRLLGHSALLGLGVTLIVYLVALRPTSQARGVPGRRCRDTLAVFGMLVPPLVAGVGILALGRAALLCSRFFSASLEWSRAGLWMHRLSLVLDPMFLPGALVFVGACLAYLPRWFSARLMPLGRDDVSGRRADQIRIARGGHPFAFGSVWHDMRGIPLATMVLWGTLAATAITPAIILGPLLESRPVGAGIVILANQPDDSRAQAAALALLMIAIDMLVLGWASARVGRERGIQAADLA